MPSKEEAGPRPRGGGAHPKPAPTPHQLPTLPPNVSIWTPAKPAVSNALLSGQLFSRLTVSAQTHPSALAKALQAHPTVSPAFCLTHQNVVLVFDAAQAADDDVADAHHEHVRAVCLALKDGDIGLDIAGCVFDSANALQAGFQCEKLRDGAVMVVDIMSGGEEDSEEEEEEEEEDGLDVLLRAGETAG